MFIFIKLAVHIVTSCFSSNTGKISSGENSHCHTDLQLAFDDPRNEHQILRGFPLVMQFYFKSAETEIRWFRWLI